MKTKAFYISYLVTVRVDAKDEIAAFERVHDKLTRFTRGIDLEGLCSLKPQYAEDVETGHISDVR